MDCREHQNRRRKCGHHGHQIRDAELEFGRSATGRRVQGGERGGAEHREELDTID
jgi:hypothetical protein